MVTSFNLLFSLCLLLVMGISSAAKSSSTPNRLQRLMRSSLSKTASVDTARLVPTCVMGSHILEIRGGADDRRSPSRKFLNWVVSALRRALRFLGVHSAPSRSFNSSGGKTTAKKKTKKTKSTRASETAAVKAPVPKKSERIVAAKRPLPASSVAGGSSLARIQRELQSFLESPPSNCAVTVDEGNLRRWTVSLTGPPDTVYAGETYKLRIDFGADYPSRPPAVYFLQPVPRHKHVYSNGDICLNLLGKDWRPIMTAEGLAVSILSMLSSAKEKATPPDNAAHADHAPGQRQDYLYHDDKC